MSARSRRDASLVYVGIKQQVLAFDRRTGTEVWRVALPAKYKAGATMVNVVRDAEGLFAAFAGEIFALDPATGQILWHDPMKGLGTGLATIATDLGGSSQVTMLEAQRAQEAAAKSGSHTATM